MTRLEIQFLYVGMLLLLSLATAFPKHSAAAEPNHLTAEELADGWILLFDGETTFGWQPASAADWTVRDSAITASSGQQGLLHTTSEFADFALKLDFRAEAKTNSGVFLRTPARPANPAADCYELNIAGPSVSPFPTGSFVGREKSEQEVKSSTDWQTYEIVADGGRFVVKLNGMEVLDYADEKPLARGFIGLQFNSGRVEFRNVKLKPLGLEKLFNGRDLSGWKAFPSKASEFSVSDEGHLTIKNGPGALESESRFGDFVLQVDARTNGKHLNSGIFFRSIPGEFNNGYESQIHNGFKDGDRTQPIDCGTGGFYRRQNARRVVADDFHWFTKTLIVCGPHMAAWVDGYQVSDWTDTRKPHDNPRQGLRTAAGTFILQGHDPTTDLSFRNFRAAELPAGDLRSVQPAADGKP